MSLLSDHGGARLRQSGGDVDLATFAAQMGYDDTLITRLSVIWGKSPSYAGGRLSLLLGHLLDTAAVAERMWDGWLAESIKTLLDEVAGGDGLSFFMWLCGIHDCGKATPAHQSLDVQSARPVLDSGLSWPSTGAKLSGWRHDRAGGKIMCDLLRDRWAKEQVDWVWPIVAGHHGRFPPRGALNERQSRDHHHGKGSDWRAVQSAVVNVFTRAIGYADLDSVEPLRMPTRSEQLVLSGLVVMADWIASMENHFGGISDLNAVSLANSRTRAARAWQELGIRGGWGLLPVPACDDLVRERFADTARPFQRVLLDVARTTPTPGLLIVEAPMGEGKTKGALAAAEILAARFGADGVFLGMPTQATCDPMYSLMRAWAETFGGAVATQVALLHGKSRFNPEWRRALEGSQPQAEDGFNIDEDLYSEAPRSCDGSDRQAPAEWFFGTKRGLLAAFSVGTVDQLLHAATRTSHVMLRFAGLVGKVVIIDEVHAADIYMEQFLTEALRWLGQARVPVILLSATLAPDQRRTLAEAYLGGALSAADFSAHGLPAPGGYPSVTAVMAGEDRSPQYLVRHAPAWRPSMPVRVQVLQDASTLPTRVPVMVEEKVAAGGVALVIMNSVARAQYVYGELSQRFGTDVVLLHGRLCAADRAERTDDCIKKLSPGGTRPGRMIVVATQVAEQSFDIDADLLVTDIAPIDLLLQRIGRVHRHDGTRRPPGLETPLVVVTGFEMTDGGPRFEGACKAIYGAYRLIRATGKVVEACSSEGWSIPSQVPQLVEEVYGVARFMDPAWLPAHDLAEKEWLREQEKRTGSAAKFLLGRPRESTAATLSGLHYGDTHGVAEDEALDAVVRDGDPTVEVVIVRRTQRGYRTLRGVPIGVNGEASENLIDEVLGGTTRLPAKLTALAKENLGPLNGWLGHQWLKHSRALVLEQAGTAQLGTYVLGYDAELGLTVGSGPSRSDHPR
jgi:CRISPR-associated endonuclease/helicase Cas3